jgi:hypothetical protein
MKCFQDKKYLSTLLSKENMAVNGNIFTERKDCLREYSNAELIKKFR